MTAPWREAARDLSRDLEAIFGPRLRSVVAYGPHVEREADGPVMTMALVASLTIEDLNACAARVGRWSKVGIATPLVLPEDEFNRSLDVFPLEYGEIVRAHERVFGPDPFEQIVVAPADLRRAIEMQIKSLLVHLREGYIEAAGDTRAISALVAAAAPASAALLRNVGRLHRVSSTERMDATRQGAAHVGIAPGVVEALLDLEDRPAAGVVDGARLFPEYLAAIEQMADAVDRWDA